MRTLAFFALTMCAVADPGWFRQNSPTTNNLNALAILDANTLVAVGARGTILRTTDGGATWKPQASGTASDLLQLRSPMRIAQLRWVDAAG